MFFLFFFFLLQVSVIRRRFFTSNREHNKDIAHTRWRSFKGNSVGETMRSLVVRIGGSRGCAGVSSRTSVTSGSLLPPPSFSLSSGFYLRLFTLRGAETIRLHAYTSLGIFIPLSTFEGVPPRLCLSLIPYTSQTESLFCPSRPIRCLFSRVRVRV